MLPHISKGDFVWLDSALVVQNGGRQFGGTHPPDFPAIAARVLAIWADQQGGEHILLLDDRQNKLELGSVELQRWAIRPMHPTSIQGVPNLVEMAEVHEAALLRNLQIRFKQHIFHTSIGSNILLSIFPQENSSNQRQQEYRERPIRELSPHLFSIGAQILNGFKNRNEFFEPNSQNCCVVFSGESGSGKTKSVKELLNFLIPNNSTDLKAKINATNLLLEAFGNAKNSQNLNGSRHGKQIECEFAENSDGELIISGICFELYLLEKSRIVEAATNASNDGNFHIFFSLLTGINSQQKLQMDLAMDRPNNYRLLNSIRQNSYNSPEDEYFWQNKIKLAEIVSAMRILQFREAEIDSILRILAAILHLGNLTYSVGNVDGKLELNDRQNIQRICRLLKFDVIFFHSILTTKNIFINGEEIQKGMQIEEAVNLRDKLIIELYARIVEYIFTKINETLAPTKTLRKEQKIGSIHLLDFQGIENNLKYDNNFEQLALNYAAECVQQFFIRRIYKLEEVEYAAQGIPDWEPGSISFIDNLQILEMLAVQPLSIMSVIDDISIMPNATDDELLAKLHKTQTQNERFYQKPKSDLVKQFAIRHYCGTVQYKVNGMIEKNRDQFPGHLRALVHSSESKFFRRIFEPNLPISMAGKLKNNREDGISSTTTISRLKEQSQSTRIRRAMDNLMSRMEKCKQVYFVRCLKANDQQNEKEFDSDVVLRQIRNFDLLSNIEMCKAAFPIQIEYAQFVHKFRPLLPGIPPPQFCHCAQTAKFICRQIFGHNFCAEIVQFGKNKIFMKAEQHQILEIMRERRLKRCAILMGKCLQGWAKRQQFERLRWAAIVLQKNWRTLAKRRNFQKFIRGITRLQASVRAHQLVIRYQWLRNTIVHFQANCRSALLRHQLGCLATGAERHLAMRERLEWQMISQGEAPALELHRNELDSCLNTNFHSINLAPKIGKIVQENGQGILQNDGIEKFKWEKFALANFQKGQYPKHSRLQIHRSLLLQPILFDELMAIAIWRRLLQLMGDLNVINESKNDTKNGIPSILARMKAIYSKEFKQNELKYLHSKLINCQNFDENANNLKKSTKMARNLLIEEGKSMGLEKIQFIFAAGIFRPNLRDEIYSQICKQINGNPSKQSSERGWNLLMLLSSCFMPSQRLLPYLLNFVKSNKCTKFEEEFEWRMQKTRKNGTRKEPIIRAELASIFASKSMIINVKLADGHLIQLAIDSQSTASELCANLSSKINLKNSFGFGLILSAGQNVRTLGAGREKLMDAFSQAEQQGIENWEIYLRKEIFQPFKSSVPDPISIDLAYRQIVRGIHLGEYQCEKEEELALLAAQQYFIAKNGENQLEIYVPDLEETLEEYLPLAIWQNIAQGDGAELRQKWIQLILNSHRKKIIKNEELPVPSVAQIKYQFLQFAALKWPLLFSKFFEVYKYSGPSLPANQLILGVNSEGIVFLDPKDDEQRILLEIEFIQLESIGYGRSKQQGAEAISLQMLNGDRFTFQSSMARELSQLLSYMLHGLQNQSRFAIATKNNANFSNNAIGDLLILNSPFGEQMASLKLNCGQICLENTRTGMRQNVPLDAIHILACTQKPGLDQIELFLSKKLEENVNIIEQEKIYNSSNTLYEYSAFFPAGPFGMPIPFFGHLPPQPHTLEKFAANNFRQPQIVLFRIYGGQEELWRHSRNPLNGPLLKRIESSGKEEVIQECLISYSYILKYMGDQPSHPQQYFLEHSDLIFAAPLKYEILRDETYCQLMKQLTENGNPMSEERGWELMWLCLGLFPPSKGLRRELNQFLRSRFLPMAADCAIRLERALGQWPDQSCTRNFGPHQVELEAIQHRQTQIFHKFYLPDGSQDTIEVESWTRGKDFAQRIATKIKLASAKGFALFVKLGEKVICIPEYEFFFDFIHQLQDWARKNARRKNGGIGINSCNFNYQVHFMRKLWLDVEPGIDIREDLIFNYPQELPKYLRGYHRIDKKEAIHFGALVLRAQTRDEKKVPLQHIQHILHELVPKDLLKSYSPNEWKKLISMEIERPEFPRKSADAKIEFLKRIGREQTFGSAFFEVKQSADPTLCSKLLVAINREGMSLYEQECKRHIQTVAFEQISHWQPAITYFHITLDKGNRLLFETTLGHKLDDLLTSYIQALIARQGMEMTTAKKPIILEEYSRKSAINGYRESA